MAFLQIKNDEKVKINNEVYFQMNLHKVLEYVGVVASLATVFVDLADRGASYSLKTGVGFTEKRYQTLGVN